MVDRLVVFTLADCNSAGNQMPASIGRKLQAFRDLFFPTLNSRSGRSRSPSSRPSGSGLPSTPLKASERRADRWRAAYGVEQTEIDALARCGRTLLAEILTDAVLPFYDHTLASRVAEARAAWPPVAVRFSEHRAGWR